MQKNWLNFYEKKEAPTYPSTFAEFVMSRNLPGETIVDLGSGNGRDTYLLGDRYKALGVDPAALPDAGNGADFNMAPWHAALPAIQRADIVYSRFFLHAIPVEDVREIVRHTPKYFCAEARAIGDKPEVYPEHERHYIDGDWLLALLVQEKFEVLFYEKNRGLAPYKNEDPLLVRVIAKRI